MHLMGWLDERTGIKEYWKKKKALLIPDHVTFFYCFGGISLTILFLQLVSGLFMTLFYVPKPEEAFKSILRMSSEIPLGGLTRNMHRWGATILIATVITHMFNVFYHKAFQRPRELNWLSGFTMFIVVFLFSITGMILPWNWTSYWVLVMWTDYVGTFPVIGQFLTGPLIEYFSVVRSFVIHVLILPLISAVFLILHFKMVKRHGISGPL
ncbi:MAG: cytochrome b N-terminal domain-containing protein [Deltaproteobacteria bacterium]|nr:cytochrome b N-terminal domain-containing protein [Deltaproteobacteria bacterium]